MKNLEKFGGSILSRTELKNIYCAASSSADCGGGISVSCSGSECSSRDGDRCSCVQAGGGSVTKLCPIQ
jgi:hypothetical protein